MTQKEKDIAQALEMIEKMGGAKALAREMEEFGALADSFYAHHEELVRKYPDQWIGMYRDKIVVAKELEDLIARMDEAGIPPGQGFVEFLSTEPIEWIL